LAHPRPRQTGFTLLEIMIAMVIVVIGLIGLVSAITYTTRMNAANRENLAALRGAEQILEHLRSVSYSEIFRRYNKSTADDVGLTLPLVNHSLWHPSFNVWQFWVSGLDPDPLGGTPDSNGPSGTITFPGDGITLLESTTDADHGLPRDLNGDGDAVDNVTGDYKLLPVTITVSWTGVMGSRTVTYRHLLFRK
jgi:prepilin-type N-terminal cleavage/methylation domain-containing protein